MGTKLKPGLYDCLAKAEPDEPVFVLRAKDPTAAALVWMWAAVAEIQGVHEPEKVREARQLMVDMTEWAHHKGIAVCGLGVAALAAVMEMIRAANTAVAQLRKAGGDDGPTMQQTTADVFRLFLAETQAA